MIINFINNLILMYLQWNLKRIRKNNNTPYLYIKVTGKDYPKYLMYTDDKKIRNQMHDIY